MILGHVRDGFPRIVLTMAGADGHPSAVDVIVDTAFDGELKLPAEIARRLAVAETGPQTRLLADGSLVDCPVYQATVIWNEAPRLVEVLVLPGNALIGTLLLDGTHLDIEMEEGGEVVVEIS